MRKLSVNSSMSRPPKPVAQAKRVAPPAVPDVYRHSGSSFGSAGYGSSEDTGGFMLPADTPPNALGIRVPREPLTHKAAVYYHQQLALQEDQGIDLTQSPGRDSPGSSSGSAGSGSRHSTASLDSGRASSYHTQSSTSRGALSSPRCSMSSCSIGSVDRISQRSDHEIITDWLRELGFDEYAQLFATAGYDMATISRMTPEDLTAIGIKKPHHRERIKQHIDAMQLPDNLPTNVPGSIEEWLRLLRLDEYIQPLLAQGYETVRDVTQLPWEDMEDIGIFKLGHQKKLLLAIKRVNDILSGKWQSIVGSSGGGGSGVSLLSSSSASSQCTQLQQQHQQHQQLQQQQQQQQRQQQQAQQMVAWEQKHMMFQSAFMDSGDTKNDIVLIKLRQPRGKSLESLEDPNERMCGHLTFTRPTDLMPAYYAPCQTGNVHDSVDGGGGGCGGGGDDDDGVNGCTMLHYKQQHSIQQMPWRRSYDDGDITPTNEIGLSGGGGGGGGGGGVGIGIGVDQQHGGTLPRHHRGNTPRQRPIAHVIGNISQQQQQQQQQPLQQQTDALLMCHTKCFGAHCTRPPQLIDPLGVAAGKRFPPEPPRRQCSVPTGASDAGHFDIGHAYHSPQHQLYAAHHQQQLQLQQQHHQQHHHHHPHHHMTAPVAVHAQQHQTIGPIAFKGHPPPVYANFVGQTQQTTVEIHSEKPHDSKSTSSIDSIDAIPFANDNAGTIKQRTLSNRQDFQSSSLSSSSSSSSLATTVANIGAGAGHPMMSLSGNGTGTTGLPSNCATATPSPTSSSSCSSLAGGTGAGCANGSGGCGCGNGCGGDDDETAIAAVAAAAAVTIDSNVLNDIGNMLANLTDELDAMLEEEKRAGLNDSE